MTERGARTDEALDLLRRLWREDRVTAVGWHAALNDVTLRPRPVQRGGPPLWIGGRSEAALRRTARIGDGYLPYMLTPSRYRAASERIDALCADTRRDPAKIERALMIYVNIAGDHETAARDASAELTRVYNQPFDELVERYCVIGTPDDCSARLAEFLAAGVRHFVFNWACRGAQILEQMERLAAEVLPAVSGARG